MTGQTVWPNFDRETACRGQDGDGRSKPAWPKKRRPAVQRDEYSIAYIEHVV